MNNYLIMLENLVDRIDKEFKEYKQQKIQGSSLKDIFENCFEISFYTAFRDFLISDEYPNSVIDLLDDKEYPLSFLYNEYLSSDFNIGYSNEAILEFLSFVVEANEETMKVYNVSYSKNQVNQTILVQAPTGHIAVAYVFENKPGAIISGANVATKDDMRPDKPRIVVSKEYVENYYERQKRDLPFGPQ